ncbi:MAG: hypothetical protein GX764_02255, partial [Firmicutes bacterium]|nr:hypothetical protein [Bacillota bacterium]
GLLELEPEVERRIAWAGPLLNFLLVGLALVVYNNNYYFGPLTENNLLFFIQANLMLAFFNLFPALPLDGGRILRAMLTQRYGFRRATEIATFMAKVLAIFIFASGILLFLQGEFNLTIFIAAGFLYIASTHEQGMAIYAFLHSLSAKELEMERRGGMRGEQLVVHEEAQVNDVLRLFAPKRYHFVRVVDHSRQVLGEISETKLLEAALKKGIHFPVKKIL